MQEQFSKSDTSHKDMDDTVLRLRQNEEQIVNLKEEISKMKDSNKDLQSKLVEVKRQLKLLDDQHTKLKGTYKPRLDETKNHQQEIVKEIKTLREDSAMLPEMFRELVS